MYCHEFNSIDEVLFYGVKELLENGQYSSPRGERTKEILGYSFKLLNPRSRLINNKSRNWNFAYALGELCWHLNASDILDEITYYSKVWNKFSVDQKTIKASCYGKKIFSSNEKDKQQWQNIIDIINSDMNTRRAVLVLNKEEDLFSIDVSCVTSIQFIIRDNKLNCITNMRSNDIIWGMCYDVFFITFLQEMLAVETGFELGWYMHNASSYHLYERHIKMGLEIVSEGVPISTKSMDPLTDLEFLGKYLKIEKQLRLGQEVTENRLKSLPKYWRNLTTPLVELSKRNQIKK